MHWLSIKPSFNTGTKVLQVARMEHQKGKHKGKGHEPPPPAESNENFFDFTMNDSVDIWAEKFSNTLRRQTMLYVCVCLYTFVPLPFHLSVYSSQPR